MTESPPENTVPKPAKREKIGFWGPASIVLLLALTAVGTYYVRKHLNAQGMLSAMKAKDWEMIRHFAESWPSAARVKNERGETPLHKVAESGDLATAGILLDHGADVNAVDWVRVGPAGGSPDEDEEADAYKGSVFRNLMKDYLQERTPLHRALAKDRWDMARFLIVRGANVNQRTDNGDVRGYSPWELAVHDADPEFIAFLLRSGAEIREQHPSLFGTPEKPIPILPLDRPEIVKVMLENVCEADRAEILNGGFLMEAVSDNQPATAKVLIDHGSRLDLPDEDGQTALHKTAEAGSPNCVQLLLDLGADFTTKDKKGKTPLALALEHKHDDVANILRKAGAKE